MPLMYVAADGSFGMAEGMIVFDTAPLSEAMLMAVAETSDEFRVDAAKMWVEHTHAEMWEVRNQRIRNTIPKLPTNN